MSFLEEFGRRREAEFRSHISDDVQALVDSGKRLDWVEFSQLHLNSYEAVLVYPLLTDEAFCQLVRHFLNNCQERKLGQFQVPTTYDEALLGMLVYQLCGRLEKR